MRARLVGAGIVFALVVFVVRYGLTPGWDE